MKLLINEINRNEKISKKGKEYTQLVIKSGGKTYYGFREDWNDDWKLGDVVDVIVEQSGNFLNITGLEGKEEKPKESSKSDYSSRLDNKIDRIESKMDRILSLVEDIHETTSNS